MDAMFEHYGAFDWWLDRLGHMELINDHLYAERPMKPGFLDTCWYRGQFFPPL